MRYDLGKASDLCQLRRDLWILRSYCSKIDNEPFIFCVCRLHLGRGGVGRCERWVRKWRKRYEEEGWLGLHSRSRRPHRLAKQVRGSAAIHTHLKERRVTEIPSKRTIERYLHDARMIHPRQAKQRESPYPKLQVKKPQELLQVDIYPRYLKGGQSVACFNAIDVATRYPRMPILIGGVWMRRTSCYAYGKLKACPPLRKSAASAAASPIPASWARWSVWR